MWKNPFRIAYLLALTACGPDRVRPDGGPLHEGDAWFAWRAGALGLDPAAARARDAALPEGGLDDDAPALRAQAALLWQSRCATCHGEDGVPPERPGQPMPRTWTGMGATMGFTFGGDGMRAGVFRSIAAGKGTAMPPWGGVLAREQIQALVTHIESF